jgi:hypothetical protein
MIGLSLVVISRIMTHQFELLDREPVTSPYSVQAPGGFGPRRPEDGTFDRMQHHVISL